MKSPIAALMFCATATRQKAGLPGRSALGFQRSFAVESSVPALEDSDTPGAPASFLDGSVLGLQRSVKLVKRSLPVMEVGDDLPAAPVSFVQVSGKQALAQLVTDAADLPAPASFPDGSVLGLQRSVKVVKRSLPVLEEGDDLPAAPASFVQISGKEAPAQLVTDSADRRAPANFLDGSVLGLQRSVNVDKRSLPVLEEGDDLPTAPASFVQVSSKKALAQLVTASADLRAPASISWSSVVGLQRSAEVVTRAPLVSEEDEEVIDVPASFMQLSSNIAAAGQQGMPGVLGFQRWTKPSTVVLPSESDDDM